MFHNEAGPQPLSPYTVIDLTEGGFNWCGKVLADFGADVIKIESRGGSPTRERGPFLNGQRGNDFSLFWAAYCVNKRSVTLDLDGPDDTAQLRALVETADVIVESFAPGHLASIGLGYDDLAPVNPGLVYTSITPFGQTGPYAQFQAPDLVAWSMGGMQYICGDRDRPPVRISAPQAELHAGAQAVAGTMAALWERGRSGLGQHVDVSMQTAVIWTLMNATPFPPLHGTNLERDGAFRSRGPLAVRQVFTCKDGHVSLLMAPRSLEGITQWMAEQRVCPAWLMEIDWDDWNLISAAIDRDSEAIELFYKIQGEIEAFVATRTKDELYSRAIDAGLLLAPCQTVEDIANSEQLAAREFWLEAEYAAVDRKLRHLGPYVKFSETPITLRRPAPTVGEHNEDVLRTLQSDRAGGTRTSAPAFGTARDMPFAGLRVLDFTWVGVGPITIKHLADFGADVVRIESVSRPDVLRNGAPFKDAKPGINRSQFSANYNSSKRGLGLNLSSEEGRALAGQIIREWQPDVIAESFTPRVMTGWGLAYEDVRKLVPDVVYFSTCQQGHTGPHAKYAGFGQLAGALAGFYHITGWPDRAPGGPYGAYSDFVNPPNAAAAIVAALEYRRRTGVGQHLDQSQYECATHFLAPEIMNYMNGGGVLDRRGNADDRFAPHGVYRCADASRKYTGAGDSWLAIAIMDNVQWRTLCDAMRRSDLRDDPRFSDMEGRRLAAEHIDVAIESWTREKNARELMEALQSVGVPAGVVQSQADLWEDPQIAHRSFFEWLDHAECGPMPYDGLTYHLSRTPGALRMPQALIGQHNFEILSNVLNMDETDVRGLLESGVLEQS